VQDREFHSDFEKALGGEGTGIDFLSDIITMIVTMSFH
jgi:hypothetical protein